MIEIYRDFGIKEIVRTGIVALSRGKVLQKKEEKIS